MEELPSNGQTEFQQGCLCLQPPDAALNADDNTADPGNISSEDGGLLDETSSSDLAVATGGAVAFDENSPLASATEEAAVSLQPADRIAFFRLSLGSSGGGGGGCGFSDAGLRMNLTVIGQSVSDTSPTSPLSGDTVFVESSALSPLQQAQSLPRRLEISSPSVRLLETRKEGLARVAVIKKSQSTSSAAVKVAKPGRLKSHRLLLTGPDLLLYRGSGGGGSTDKRRRQADVTLSLAAAYWMAVPGNDKALHLRCELSQGGHAAGSKDAVTDDKRQLFECHIQWETVELRRAWEAALTMAKDLLLNKQFTQQQQQQPGHLAGLQPARQTIVQRLNDFFRRRPAIDELERRGIVRSEPVFGASLADVCARDGADTPLFLRLCIAALESRGGLETVGLYRVGGNAATVQRLRLLVDQSADYDLNQPHWDINVLASALKTFLRELRQPLLGPELFQSVARHHQSGAKPSMRRGAIWQELQAAAGLPTMRLLFGHLYRVVQHSERNQMTARNLAVVIGPNLLWPAGASAVACRTGCGLATDLALQTGVVEYLILEANYLFDLSRN